MTVAVVIDNGEVGQFWDGLRWKVLDRHLFLYSRSTVEMGEDGGFGREEIDLDEKWVRC